MFTTVVTNVTLGVLAVTRGFGLRAILSVNTTLNNTFNSTQLRETLTSARPALAISDGDDAEPNAGALKPRQLIVSNGLAFASF
jgi:hypothetical protein